MTETVKVFLYFPIMSYFLKNTAILREKIDVFLKNSQKTKTI